MLSHKVKIGLCAAAAVGYVGGLLSIAPAVAIAVGHGAIGVDPGNSATVVNLGSTASELVSWATAIFIPVVGTFVSAAVFNLTKKYGIDISYAQREQLQEIVVNGLNAGAAIAAKAAAETPSVDVKSVAVAHAIQYVQAHGADTLKALGIDPSNPQAIEAITARIETAIHDHAQPTAPILGGPFSGVVVDTGATHG